MKNIVKKSILIGLGALSFTDKQLEKAIRGLEKSKHISAGEGEELIKEISEQMKKKQREISGFIANRTVKTLKEIRLATQKQLSQLEKKLSAKK